MNRNCVYNKSIIQKHCCQGDNFFFNKKYSLDIKTFVVCSRDKKFLIQYVKFNTGSEFCKISRLKSSLGPLIKELFILMVNQNLK